MGLHDRLARQGDSPATVTVLENGGRLVLLVPAHSALYSDMDRNIEHFRRYDLRSLGKMVEDAGFKVVHQRHLNMLGAIGWFVNGRILRRQLIPSRQLRIFAVRQRLRRLHDPEDRERFRDQRDGCQRLRRRHRRLGRRGDVHRIANHRCEPRPAAHRRPAAQHVAVGEVCDWRNPRRGERSRRAHDQAGGGDRRDVGGDGAACYDRQGECGPRRGSQPAITAMA